MLDVEVRCVVEDGDDLAIVAGCAVGRIRHAAVWGDGNGVERDRLGRGGCWGWSVGCDFSHLAACGLVVTEGFM